uniref:Acetyl-coenzyme A carboxylase carboxyl transferase alpha n=1 Tax=Solanum tuberosum TaxID=4113 RepID=M1AUM7_SOLTU
MLCMKWVELHGDRAGYDDTAIVSDIGSIEGRSYLLIGGSGKTLAIGCANKWLMLENSAFYGSRVIQVIPTLRSHDIRHESVSKDDRGVRPPRTPQPNSTSAS